MKPSKARALVGAAAAAALSCGAWVALRAQTGSGQAAAFRTGGELVTGDGGVVDRQGHPLRGLTPDDVVGTVAGPPRRVGSAEFVDTAAVRRDAPRRADAVPVSTNEGAGLGRLFAFMVDQGTLEPGNVRHIARAATRFFDRLTFADRSALLLMPAGPNVEFTWAHDRVRDALGRVVGQASPMAAWEFGSLTDARDIASRNPMALRTLGQRECGTGVQASGGGFTPGGTGGVASPPTPAPPSAPTGGESPGGAQPGGSGQAPGGGTQPASGNSGTRGSGNSGFGADSCTRDLQMRAEWAWRGAQMTSHASLSAFRHALAMLAAIPGDKTVVLISGGWPLEEREQNSLIASVAAEAAAARVTLYTLFVPATTASATRRVVSTTPTNDTWLHAWPLETLASMTGGAFHRIDVGAEGAFERLGRELSGFYRIGVEKTAADVGEKPLRLKVQVARSSVTVRARELFDIRTYEDRDWAGRLAAALDAPIAATGIGLRVTSYLAADPDDGAKLKMVLAGEATRLDPGDATVQVVVRDLAGKKLLAGEQPIGEPTGDGLSFAANVPIAPGSYILRVAVIDGAGHVGSVDHRIDVQPVPLGELSATGPLLIRVPADGSARPRVAMDGVRQDERLALQIDLEGERSRLTGAGVVFEIAATPDGPSLLQAPAEISQGARGGWLLAQAVADLRALPPGNYIARAKVSTGSEALGEVRRAFAVTDAPALPAGAANAAGEAGTAVAPTAVNRSIAVAPAFAMDHVLAPRVLDPFLDRVAARPDASAPRVRELIDAARSRGLDQLAVSDALAAQSPVAAFLRGLTLFRENKLEHAASAFRSAMRMSEDFYPAMVYLGACYAAGGNDKEAAGAWRTALIKEGDALPLHLLLADSLLRQDRRELALETLDGARARWPADDDLKRRFVMAALLAGELADGLQTLDELVAAHTEDEPSLAVALLVLYQAQAKARPIETPEQDRARMLRLADAYRARGGPSLALVNAWMAEVGERR
jgi:VWFA-related protein